MPQYFNREENESIIEEIQLCREWVNTHKIGAVQSSYHSSICIEEKTTLACSRNYVALKREPIPQVPVNNWFIFWGVEDEQTFFRLKNREIEESYFTKLPKKPEAFLPSLHCTALWTVKHLVKVPYTENLACVTFTWLCRKPFLCFNTNFPITFCIKSQFSIWSQKFLLQEIIFVFLVSLILY